MDARKLSDEFSVSPQVDASEMDEIVQAGFKSILCNRPDGEEYGQPEYDDVAKAAEAAGLEVRSVPIVSGMVTPQAAQDFAQALEDMPKPILAYCRTGTRCTMLWSLVKFDDLGGDAILKATQEAGYDMGGLVRQLQAR
ncbi:TIGR01244 family phosphatase [Roseovarius sp. A21]|uniref:TIGR01244 family phosphatase n=1 Tax=Roseovarius bejariae TaxID=2576383 RepID=A0A844CXT5_9RHOB|nr:TIGR01244 family sulfur transferase [Roseovarius bejariae]MRU15926.1 TIGR01244 family phosphatase [Roseovarius bejariae]